MRTGKQIGFFALKQDLEDILKDMESLFDIKYYKTGLLDSSNIQAYESIFELPDMGYTRFRDHNKTETFLIIPQKASLCIEEVPQRKGGVKYAVDQLINPQSIILNLGGVYTEKENVLISGRSGTVSNDPFSLDIYKFFSSKLKKQFKRIGAYYVGREAEKRLLEGWRLVYSEGQPKEYDLVVQ